jgi:NhaP-type Na+/H+ or K+/H+ antiporter
MAPEATMNTILDFGGQVLIAMLQLAVAGIVAGCVIAAFIYWLYRKGLDAEADERVALQLRRVRAPEGAVKPAKPTYYSDGT